MSNQFNLTQAQLTQLSTITNSGTSNFAQGYNYISSVISASALVDSNTKFWFQQAANINANTSNSAANFFIRQVTSFGLQWDGISNVDISAISNGIGQSVLEQVLGDGGIPQLSDILAHDISVVTENFGVSIGGWGGSFYCWDLEFTDQNGYTATVGQRIQSSPVEMEKFIAVNAEALANTIVGVSGQFLNGDFSHALDVLLSSLDADVPAGVAHEIVLRAFDQLSDAGHPNFIGGYTYLDGGWYVVTEMGTIPVDAETAAFLNERRAIRLEKQELEFEESQYCFAPGTHISIPGGKAIRIQEISATEVVTSFGEEGDASAAVTRVFRNVTQEWLKLVPFQDGYKAPIARLGVIPLCRDGFVDDTATYVTPGHVFLNEHRKFEQIEKIVQRGGMIVREDGSLRQVTAERLVD